MLIIMILGPIPVAYLTMANTDAMQACENATQKLHHFQFSCSPVVGAYQTFNASLRHRKKTRDRSVIAHP